MNAYSYDRTASLTTRSSLDEVVGQLRRVASTLDLTKSMPASAANTLERLEDMGHFKGWSKLDDRGKSEILSLVQDLSEKVKETEAAGRKLWRHMER